MLTLILLTVKFIKLIVFFQVHKNTIQIQLYFGTFYFTINNFPIYVNSKLKNIFLVALCYNANIKEFGINPVLEVIVKNIKILETQGIFIESLNIYLKGTLISTSCDNLAGAMLLGMNKSFNSHYYCKICTMSKEKAQKACIADLSLLRTTESFVYLADQQKYANSDTINFFGIKHKSALLNLTL